MARPRSPLFVERQSYRRRRMMDGARILPVLGFVLVLLPALWTQGGTMGSAGQGLYLFGLWVALILAAAAMARPLGREGARQVPPLRPAGASDAIGAEVAVDTEVTPPDAPIEAEARP